MADVQGHDEDRTTANRRVSNITRRTLIGTSTAVAALSVLGSGAARAATATPEATTRGGARERGYAFLDAAMDGYPDSGKTRLAQSYTDQAGLFSTAFTCDNALTILAYLARPGAVSRTRAVALGDALLYAQAHDPQYDDGRLRQAYNAGPYVFYDGSSQPDGFVHADGTVNVGTQFGFTGTAVGDMAWAGIALAALAERTHQHRFLAGAVRIGTWVETNARTGQPLGGYTFGVDGGNNKLPYSGTEHNIDLVCLFGRLARLTGNSVWLKRRARAAEFVGRMWERSGGFFYTGTNDGTTINTSPIPEDTQTWSYLALRDRYHGRSLDWAASHLKVLDTTGRPNSTVPAGQSYEGVTFSSASLTANEDAPIAQFQPKPDQNGVWFEGTAHLALALRERQAPGDTQLAARLITSIEQAQDRLGQGQTVGGKAVAEQSGVVSASSPLDTGFGFGYYPYKHIGATAWYLLAAARTNPLRGI
ncbi:Tat pathway signal sequence domain protein [Streptomyces guryensis]|uniref:Tat pathway signal sequence domain protein n=1 Tax=Streptomyces guryensis TaxID=2886947 RepID=A0A9Q3VM52_9ACTN|nr:Tat pathway signal sequence domain protein [Streptomyces guryensis]MCD9875064.1 Tat pathway signal sequence domain protein [Streptomyces guryensis]